jgi:hypothetical protein
LLGLKAFRTLVIRVLGDKTEVGTVETDGKLRVIVVQGRSRTVTNDKSTAQSVTLDSNGLKNPNTPGAKAKPLLMADLACEKFVGMEGFPRFQKHWPLETRDKAIAATVAYLTQYGERFREKAK